MTAAPKSLHDPAPPARRRFLPVPIETTYDSVRARPAKSQSQNQSQNQTRASTSGAKTPARSCTMSHQPTNVPTPEMTPEGSPRACGRGYTMYSIASSKPEIEHVEEAISREAISQEWLAPTQTHTEPHTESHTEPQHSLPRRRRFAPQLIETSRRARRIGDLGPATRPTDKTDITPYTNHIYVSHARSKKRRPDDHKDQRVFTSDRTRRETEDVAFSGYLLRLAAREAERQIQEAALAVFPNAQAREGGVAHFYFRDSEEEDSLSASTASSPRTTQDEHLLNLRASRTGPVTRGRRRKSSDLGWWRKTMQEHAQKMQGEGRAAEEDRDRDTNEKKGRNQDDDCAIDDSEFDDDHLDMDMDMDMEMEMDMEMAPPDPMWLTTNRSPSCMSTDSDAYLDGEYQMPYIPTSTYVASAAAAGQAERGGQDRDRDGQDQHRGRDLGGRDGQDRGRDLGGNGFGGRAFGGFARFAAPRETEEVRKARMAPSPPMLGKDISFRTCPSPKHTTSPLVEVPLVVAGRSRAGGEAAESQAGAEAAPQAHGENGLFHVPHEQKVSTPPGLWRGSCLRSGSECNTTYVPAGAPSHQLYLATPNEPLSPTYDPFSAAFGAAGAGGLPSPAPSASASASASLSPSAATALSPLSRDLKHSQARRAREKAQAAHEARVRSEFDDLFVTQVFNYLSLGYPPTAHDFDEELSKISRVPVAELRQDDGRRMAECRTFDVERAEEGQVEKCARWKALKKYIYEWGRQHPDLDSCHPMAWGMDE